MKRTSLLSKIFIAVFLTAMLLLCFSCDVMKQSTKSKGEASGSEMNESFRKRKGDTVSYKVPIITYKDTTIYTVNREGTTLRTVYDERGQVSQIDCFASAIEEMTRQQKQFFEQYKDKTKEKTEEFDSSFILYIVAGIVILGIVALILIFIYINNKTKSLKDAIETIAKASGT